MDRCIINKKIIMAIFALMLFLTIICFITFYKSEFIILLVAGIVLNWFIQIKYIKCKNCKAIINIWDLVLHKIEYCKKCGIKIDIE